MNFLRFIFLVLALLSPFLLEAAVWGEYLQGGWFYADYIPSGTINMDGSFPLLIANIIRYAIGLAGILGVIGVTWGGIQMILSSGDDEKFKKSRHMIIFSLIGVLVAGLAYAVVGIISSLRI